MKKKIMIMALIINGSIAARKKVEQKYKDIALPGGIYKNSNKAKDRQWCEGCKAYEVLDTQEKKKGKYKLFCSCCNYKKEHWYQKLVGAKGEADTIYYNNVNDTFHNNDGELVKD